MKRSPRSRDCRFTYLDAHPTGDLVSRVIADVEQFADGLLMGFTQLFTGVSDDPRNTGFYAVCQCADHARRCVLSHRSAFWWQVLSQSERIVMFHMQTEVRGEQTALINEMIGEPESGTGILA